MELVEFPTSPPTLDSLCLQAVLTNKLPVLDLPLTLQQDIQKLGGGHFRKISSDQQWVHNTWVSNLLGNLLNIKMFPDKYQLNGMDFCLGENKRPFFREKGWIETGGVFRYVNHWVYGDGVFFKMGWRITFTDNGITLTFTYNDFRAEIVQDEDKFKRIDFA